jgi:hypothetical protein
MPSTYSANLRLELQATGENRTTWGIKANNDFELIEDAIAGYTSIAMANANVTLTALNGTADQSRSMILNFTGTHTAIRTVTIPSVSKLYFIRNSTTGGFAINVKTSAGNTIVVGNGKSAVIFCDGTNCVSSFEGSANDITSGTLDDARLPATMTRKAFSGGLSISNTTAASNTDLSDHLQMYSGYGLNITSTTMNYTVASGASHAWNVNGTEVMRVNTSGLTLSQPLAVAEGGTGTTSAAGIRSMLGLATIATSGSASDLTTGTVPNARISGAYSGITTLGTTGTITVTTDSEAIRIAGGTTGDPYMTFFKGATRQAYIQHTDGTGVNAGLKLYNDVATGGDTSLTLRNSGGVNSLEYMVNGTEYTVIHTGNYDSLGLAPESRTITAGNGLTGGGTLAGNVTLTMGTPGSITNSTGNTVSSTSHTHALGFVAAEVYQGTGVNDTNLALGHYILAVGGSNYNRNVAVACYLYSADNFQYANDSASNKGTQLSGTWRARGTVGGGTYLMQRVA